LIEHPINQDSGERNIKPLKITYSSFAENYNKTIMEILEYLEIQAPANINIIPPPYKQLSNSQFEGLRWRYRFRSFLKKMIQGLINGSPDSSC